MNLLFDVHCAGTYLGSKSEIDKHHLVRCVGQETDLPQDMKDEDIVKLALAEGFTIVTKDIGLVRLACEKGAKIAVLKGNHIFFIEGVMKIIGRDPPKELFSQN